MFDLVQSRGHFLLESGLHGSLWLALDHLFLQPKSLHREVSKLSTLLASHRVDAVCGPLVGGALVAAMVAEDLDSQCFLAERTKAPDPGLMFSATYEIPAIMRGRVRGRRFAIVDDAIAAGSAVRSTLTHLRSLGAEPVVLGALLTVGSGAETLASRAGLTLHRLHTLDAEQWQPSECPMCRAGVPLTEPHR